MAYLVLHFNVNNVPPKNLWNWLINPLSSRVRQHERAWVGTSCPWRSLLLLTGAWKGYQYENNRCMQFMFKSGLSIFNQAVLSQTIWCSDRDIFPFSIKYFSLSQCSILVVPSCETRLAFCYLREDKMFTTVTVDCMVVSFTFLSPVNSDSGSLKNKSGTWLVFCSVQL